MYCLKWPLQPNSSKSLMGSEKGAKRSVTCCNPSSTNHCLAVRLERTNEMPPCPAVPTPPLPWTSLSSVCVVATLLTVVMSVLYILDDNIRCLLTAEWAMKSNCGPCSALKERGSGARARLCVGGAPRAGGGVRQSPEEMLQIDRVFADISKSVTVWFRFNFIKEPVTETISYAKLTVTFISTLKRN